MPIPLTFVSIFSVSLHQALLSPQLGVREKDVQVLALEHQMTRWVAGRVNQYFDTVHAR